MSINKVELPSEKSFSIVFSVFFLAIFLLFSYHGETQFILILPAILILVLGFKFPKLLRGPNIIWYKFGIFLGGLIAPIVMAVIYYSVFFPIGIILKLFGKDLLSLKYSKAKESYWITRKTKLNSMKDQF